MTLPPKYESDLLTLVDEGRHLHDQPRLELGRLGDRGGRRRFDARFGLDYGHLDYARQFDAHRLAVVKTDCNRQVRQQIVHRVAQSLALQVGLLEGLHVHEVVVVPIVVQELHLDFVNDDALNGVGRTEALDEHRAGADVAKLGLDERAEVTRRAVLHREDEVEVILELDNHARAHLRGGNRHKKTPNF
jgi:hypothetical protein